jgi:hypothetical protein
LPPPVRVERQRVAHEVVCLGGLDVETDREPAKLDAVVVVAFSEVFTGLGVVLLREADVLLLCGLPLRL